jgi:hypothetical protein
MLHKFNAHRRGDPEDPLGPCLLASGTGNVCGDSSYPTGAIAKPGLSNKLADKDEPGCGGPPDRSDASVGTIAAAADDDGVASADVFFADRSRASGSQSFLI